uniref:Uncharacterized protein n=1 Tax=Haptolina ericina TaxID=156174 RepID=A0A7S3EQK2_9EUKA
MKPWQKLVSAPGLVRRGNATAPAPVLPVAIMKPMASRLNPEEALDSLHAEATDSHEAVQRAVDERDGGHNLLMGAMGVWGLAALVFGCWVCRRILAFKRRPRKPGQPRTDLLRRY